MDSTSLRFIAKNFTTVTHAELAELMELSSRYPYSQLLHVIQTRASKDLGDRNHVDLLHRSAVYATDRSVVKWALTTPREERLPKPASPSVTATPDTSAFIQHAATPATILQQSEIKKPVKFVGLLF